MNPTHQTVQLEMVREFMRAFDQPVCKSFADADTKNAILRAELHREEFREFNNATDDPVELLDALCDIEYIACGTKLALGLSDYDGVLSNHSFAYWNSRIVTECNKSNLCESGLKVSIHGIRRYIGTHATRAYPRFHEAFCEVHRTNMAKRWDEKLITSRETGYIYKPAGVGFYIVKRPDGKVIKPPGWAKPNLEQFVD